MNAHARFDAPVLLREDAAGVSTLTLNRPEARNALSESLIAALASELGRIARDRSVRAVVLAGTGSVFSAGHDLKEMTGHRTDPDGGTAYYAALIERCSAMMQQIVRLPQPVIAAVEGIATAAGCQLVASADLAVAGASARFCTPGVHIGLFCSTPMVPLSRTVSRKHAMEMLLTGETIAAEHAARIGLVNRVVPEGEAVAAALQLAAVIAGKSKHVLALGKAAFYDQLEMSLAEAYEHASRVMVHNMMARDATEGIDAFVAKRAPVWVDA